MELGNAYIPMDWRHAFATNSSLPEKQTGATLFSDISGFTPLTEAFAIELGPKRGGEELTIHLNRVYDGLIGVLHRYGGSVISFSGDAITCWFDQDLDGRRAVRCALEMQEAMLQFAEIKTHHGRIVNLGLKVAVAIGSVKRFIVGLPEYKLFDAMTGQTVEEMAAGEGVAERGDVVIDKKTFAALEQHLEISEWRKNDQTGGDFAIVQALSLDVQEQPWETLEDIQFTQETLSRWLLPAVGRRISSNLGGFLTELRPAATLFMRFTGIDYENDNQAPDKLSTFVQQIERIMMRLDGSLLQLTIGDKGSYMYAAFGAPNAHENDVERAAMAALAIQKETGQFDYIDPVQIGISYGRMRTGAYGSSQRRTYGVLGDHVNLSARLMSKAPGGQIYISSNAHQKISRLFKWEQLPRMQVKGKSIMIDAFRLVGSKQRESIRLHEPEYSLPMVGRAEELAQISERIDLVLEGKGQIVGITAEAGMGKSRLTAEAIHIALEKGLEGYGGECQSFGTNNSYLVWENIWRNFFGLQEEQTIDGIVDQLTEQLTLINTSLIPRIPLLGAALNLPIPDNELTASLDAKTKNSSLQGLLVDVLRHNALGGPIFLVLEDCHWLDDLSKELIEEIGKAIENTPILLLLVYRPPDTHRIQMAQVYELPYFTQINLSNFSKQEAEQLIQLKIDQFFQGKEIPSRFINLILQKASGNPFYLDEIINLIQDHEIDPADENALLALDLPDTIYSLVLSRIDNLTESQKIAIRVASVIGRLFTAAMVWGIYPAQEVTSMVKDDLDRLSELELTPVEKPEPELTYLFKHIMTQEVAYESLPYKTRSILHGQIGSYVEFKFPNEIEQNLDLLAFHFGLSEDEDKKKIYWKLAGDAASKTYANGAAINYYTQLLPLIDGEERGSVLVSLGEVHELIGSRNEAESYYQEALTLAEGNGLDLLLAKSQILLGTLRRKQGQLPEAAELLNRARKKSDEINDPPGLAKAFISLGTISAMQGNFDEAIALYDQSLEIGRTIGDDAEIGDVLINMAVVAEYQGSLPRAREYLQQALEHKRLDGGKMGVAKVLNNLGYVLNELKEYSRAAPFLEEAITIFRESGDKWRVANTSNNLANVQSALQKYDHASRLYAEGLKINLEINDQWALAFLFEDIAMFLSQKESSLIALNLVGAAERIREEIESPLPDAMKTKLDQKLQPSYTAAADDADHLRTVGKGMAIDKAGAVALEALL